MASATCIKLALVDDHKLFRKGLTSLIEMVNKNCIILFEAVNGLDLQKKIEPKKNNKTPLCSFLSIEFCRCP